MTPAKRSMLDNANAAIDYIDTHWLGFVVSQAGYALYYAMYAALLKVVGFERTVVLLLIAISLNQGSLKSTLKKLGHESDSLLVEKK